MRRGLVVLRSGALSAGLWKGISPSQPLLMSASPGEPSTSAPGSANNVNSTLHALRTRDITLCVPTKDRLARVVFGSTRNIFLETVDRHDLLVATNTHVPFLQLLGTHITFANLLAALQEGEERVEVRFTGDEATVVAEALALGECRTYLRPQYNAELKEESGAPAFPLKVDRILYNQQQPFSSMVNAEFEELIACERSRDSAERNHGRDWMEAWTAVKGDATVMNTLSHGPPFALDLVHEGSAVTPEALAAFFTYNLSLHGYNYFRRSDGCVASLNLHCCLDKALLDAVPAQRNGSAAANQHGTEKQREAYQQQQQQRREALKAAVPFSHGVLVQPLAAGQAMDWRLWQLQRALAIASAADTFIPGNDSRASGDVSAHGGVLATLWERARTEQVACQDMISLVSGDYEGAFEAAVVARQYTQDPGSVAAVVEPLRRALGIADVALPLDGKEAARTGLDCFCRCSTAGILESLVTVPEETLKVLMEDNEFKCTYCGRVHHAKVHEWEHLLKVRAENKRNAERS